MNTHYGNAYGNAGMETWYEKQVKIKNEYSNICIQYTLPHTISWLYVFSIQKHVHTVYQRRLSRWPYMNTYEIKYILRLIIMRRFWHRHSTKH